MILSMWKVLMPGSCATFLHDILGKKISLYDLLSAVIGIVFVTDNN